MIRAITPISASTPLSAPGFVETGSLLDDSFMKTLRASSDSEIAIIVNGQVKVSTVAIEASTLPKHSETDLLVGPVYGEATIKGERYQAIFTLVQSHSSEPQELAVFLPLKPLDDAQREIVLVIVAGGLVLAGLAFAFSYGTARTLTGPLARLATAAARIEQGDLAAPIATGSPHEIGQLEHSFGSMAGALHIRDPHRKHLAAARVRAPVENLGFLIDPVQGAASGVLQRDAIDRPALIALVQLRTLNGGCHWVHYSDGSTGPHSATIATEGFGGFIESGDEAIMCS